MSASESGLFNFSSVPDAYRQFLQPSVFDPWARELIEFVPPARGGVLLDVAAGTGAVAHAAAGVAGPEGRVVATDVSPLMLAGTQLEQADDRSPVECLECPADGLTLPDASVDVAYCQQGLQFMADRNAVLTEIGRVLRPGGQIGVAVWSADSPPEPFATYARILQAHGIAEPYPKAYDLSTVTMAEDEIEGLLAAAGFTEVAVRTVELPLAWTEPRAAVLGIMGSSYGPTVAALEQAEQEAVFTSIAQETTGDHAGAVMSAVFGRGTRHKVDALPS